MTDPNTKPELRDESKPAGPPWHLQDPTSRFTSRADTYAQHRPGYPAAAIDSILDGLGDPAVLVAADVGAGTGISTALLADRGVTVYAVEPNANMRARIPDHPRIRPVDATAEATGLDAGSVDLVLCAQAFHWFDAGKALREFARVLRPSSRGRLALMWNQRDDRDPFTAGYTAIIVGLAEDYPAYHGEDALSTLSRLPFFENATLQTFRNEHAHTLDGLLGRAESASYAPAEGEPLENLRAQLRALHARFADADGNVRLVYETQVYLATPAREQTP